MNELQKYTNQFNDTALQNLRLSLEKQELNLQNLLVSIHNPNDIKTRESTRAEYISDYNFMVKTRKAQTEKLDDIKAYLMQFEKRADPKTALLDFDQTTLTLKKEAEHALFIQNETEKEKVNIKNYFSKMYSEIEVEYDFECLSMLNAFYLQALENESFDLSLIRQVINNIKPNFNIVAPKTQYITESEVLTIQLSIPVPELVFDPEIINQKFANFIDDLKHKIWAKEAIQEAQADALILASQQAQQRQQIAQIQTRAEVASVTVKPTFKAIKRNLQVVFNPNNAIEAREICNQFWFNELWNRDLGYLQIHSFTNLTIQQMANALSKLATETSETIDSLNYETIEK